MRSSKETAPTGENKTFEITTDSVIWDGEKILTASAPATFMCAAFVPAGRWEESEENRIWQRRMKKPISKVAAWCEAALMMQLA